MVYICNVCGNSFPKEGNLKKHMMIAHLKRKLFDCNYCGYKGTDASDLDIHMLAHKRFGCNECSYRSAKADKLKRHLLTHSGAKPYNCKQCNYKCTTTTKLKSHMVTHSEEKTFSCKKCNMNYKHAISLKRHMITHSIGELKPLKCDGCSYESTRADMLKRHILTHSGEKLLKSCKQCDYSFTDYRTLKRHLKKEHITSPTLKEQTARLESMKKDKEELRSETSTTIGAGQIKDVKPDLVDANISGTDVQMEARGPYVSFNCNVIFPVQIIQL